MNPVLFIAIPLLLSFIAGGLRSIKIFKDGWLPTAYLLLNLMLAAALFPRVLEAPINETIVIAAPLGINLYAGVLAISMIVIISIFGIVIVSSPKMRNYFSENTATNVLVLLHFAGVNGLLLSGDLFNIFVFLEIVSLSAYAITTFSDSAKSFEAAIKYLLAGSIASIALLIAVALIYFHTGTLNFAQLTEVAPLIPTSIKSVIIVVLLISFLTEAELFPFNTWVPDVYEGSGAAVSGLFSAVTVNATLYILFRVVFVFGMEKEVGNLILWIGLISMIVGELGALKQTNLVRMFAYSSMAQVGLMTVGFISNAHGGTLLYLFNHSAIKAGLFLILSLFLNKETLEDIRGIGRKYKLVGFASIVLVLSLLGLPPFSGFVGKILILKAVMTETGTIGVILILIASVIEAWYLLKLLSVIFSKEESTVKEVSIFEQLPLLIPSIFIIVVGIYPKVLLNHAQKGENELYNNSYYKTTILGESGHINE